MGGDSGETTSGESVNSNSSEVSTERASSSEVSDAFNESRDSDIDEKSDHNSDIDAEVTTTETNTVFGDGSDVEENMDDTVFGENFEKGDVTETDSYSSEADKLDAFNENQETDEENNDKIESNENNSGEGWKISETDVSDLPPNVQESFVSYENEGWIGPHNDSTPGTRGGGEFSNRDGDLPTVDNKGNPISYREFDVNNKPIDGTGRDGERFVIGSDGSVYYTGDHYDTFTKIK